MYGVKYIYLFLSSFKSLFTFKYEVNEQGGFVINDTSKKSYMQESIFSISLSLPWLIIQAKGVVSRLVAP